MRSRYLPIIVLTICMALLLTSAAGVAAEENQFTTITILSVNDFHGALEDNGHYPGAAKLASYLKSEKEKNPEGTLVVSAGDMFQGSIDSNLLYGKTVVAIMNEIGFDAMALGNHEFDWGTEKLRERIRQSYFPYVAANVQDKVTNKVPYFLQPYSIVEKKGIKIAVIGISTPETVYKANPKILAPYSFADPAATVNALIPELRLQGAQIIVVLSHLGAYLNNASHVIEGEAARFATVAKGVDALITGHSHVKLAGAVNGIPVVQAASHGQAIGKISLVYSQIDRKIVAAMTNVVDISLALNEDSDVKKIIDQAHSEISLVKHLVLGEAEATLAHDRYSLSPLGHWVTDVMRQSVQADIAFQNGGGLRTDIQAGLITLGKLYEVIPFDNTLVLMDMTGAQIRKVMEQGIGNSRVGTIQFSGLRVVYNPSLPPGARVINITLDNGSVLDNSRHYKVVTNDFLAAGGDEFIIFKEARHSVDTYWPLRDVLAEAIRKARIITTPAEGRLKLFQPGQKTIVAA